MAMTDLLILPLENVKPPGRKEMKREKRFPCKFLERVLKQVNGALEACGQPVLAGLPFGVPCHPRMDVVARALSAILAPRGEAVSSDRITVPKEFANAVANAWKTQKLPGRPYETTADVMLPRILKEFVQRFDRGKFPELVEQKP